MSETSSIGAVWPPAEASFERIRGFYPEIIQTDQDQADFVDAYLDAAQAQAEHPERSRLTVRAVVELGRVGSMHQHGLRTEGVMPLRQEGLGVAYFAQMDEARDLTEEEFQERHGGKIARALQKEQKVPSMSDVSSEFELRSIDRTTDELRKDELVPQFADLYEAFGYNKSDTQEILFNPSNRILYIAASVGAVSTAMAEVADLEIGGENIRIAEITEAFTMHDYRQRGLYQTVSGLLIQRLVEEGGFDLIYGESNMEQQGVLNAAHQNGRHFSALDGPAYGIQDPRFGALLQNFGIAEDQTATGYNDFALSYVPLGGEDA